MSRILGLVNHINPERVNPEFIGIGEEFNNNKRERMESDQHRKNVKSHFSFTSKLNQDLSKVLKEKERELKRLEEVRERHHKDMQHKIQEEEKRERELFILKQRSLQQKFSITQGIRQARNSHISKLKFRRKSLKNASNDHKACAIANSEQLFHQNKMKHKSVQLGKQIANQKINSFHRRKNYEFCKDYAQRINEENKKNTRNSEEIKAMNRQMENLQKKIEKKQFRLKEVLQKMSLFALEKPNDRKTTFLATATVFRSTSSTINSLRSRPGSILRNSLNKTRLDNEIEIDMDIE